MSEDVRYTALVPEQQRVLLEQELIANATATLRRLLASEQITTAELAQRLDRTPESVRQIFDGGRNLTLKTLARLAEAAGYRITLTAEKLGR